MFIILIPTRLLLGPVSPYSLSVIRQFADHVKVKDTSQSFNNMSNVPQQLLKYFNGAKILTFFSASIPSNSSVILVL